MPGFDIYDQAVLTQLVNEEVDTALEQTPPSGRRSLRRSISRAAWPAWTSVGPTRFGIGQFKAPNAMPALVEMPVTERREALIEMVAVGGDAPHQLRAVDPSPVLGREHPQRRRPRCRDAGTDPPSPPGASDGVDALAGVRQRFADRHVPAYQQPARHRLWLARRPSVTPATPVDRRPRNFEPVADLEAIGSRRSPTTPVTSARRFT